MNKGKTKIQTLYRTTAPTFWSLLILALILFLICINKTSSKNYSILDRTWGFDNFLYYSFSSRLAIGLLLLLFIFPYTNNFLQLPLAWLAKKLSGSGKKKLLIYLLISIAGVSFFYLFRVKYSFLGDFNLRMNQIMRKEFLGTEYITMKLLYYFARLGEKNDFTVAQMFKIYSLLAGGVYVFITCLIADLTGKTSLQKIFFFLAQTGTSLVLVFCGYVEIYATPVVLLNLYIYLGLRYLKYKSGFYLVLLSLAIAIAAHLLCLSAVPSLFVLWYFNNKSKVTFISGATNKKIGMTLSILLFLSVFIALKIGHGFLLPLEAPKTQPKYMTFLSFRHLWETLNGQLLCCGISFLVIFSLLVTAIKQKLTLEHQHYFLLSITGFTFLLVLVANLQRGSGDWDIMGFTAVTLPLCVAMLVAHLYRNVIPRANYLIFALIGINFINAALWIHINHTDKSIAKIKDMLIKDPGSYYLARISGVVQLAVIFNANKLRQETEKMALYACSISAATEVKACVMYGLSLKESGKLNEAQVYFENLLSNRSPFVLEAYLFLIEHFQKTRQDSKYLLYLNRFFDAFALQPDPFFNNINFKPSILIGLFNNLHLNSKQFKDTARLKRIEEIVEGLKKVERQKGK